MDNYYLPSADFDINLSAALDGDPEAQLKLGMTFYFGDGVGQNYEHAFHWYEKAASRGNAMAMCNCHDMLVKGTGVPKDLRSAKLWAESAAVRGDAYGQFFLARMHEQNIGRPKDARLAAKWYRMAANLGCAHGQNNYGLMQIYGEGIRQNIPSGLEWINQAMKQDHPTAFYNAGILASEGVFVQLDPELAFECFSRAEELGYPEARVVLDNWCQVDVF